MGDALVTLTLAAGAVWAALWLLPWQPHRTRERFEPGAAPHGRDLAEVTVIVPARNEAEHLPATLSCLARQGPNLRVVVVDDESTDATASVLADLTAGLGAAGPERYALEIVSLQGQALAEGWGGKLWALQQGLAQSDRTYTLLLDADIELAPGCVTALLEIASARRAALVSVMALLRVETFWERLLVPSFIFFFKLLYPFAGINNPRSKIAGAAGGLILVETGVLREIGGFESLRAELIDDCSLAAKVKRQGYGIWLGLSRSVRSRRAYVALRDFWSMVRRTAYTQLRYSALLLLLTTAAMLWLLAVPVWAFVTGGFSARGACGLAVWLAMSAAYVPVVAFYRLPLLWVLTLPLAGLLFLAMTWDSALGYWRGTRARWKGRAYEVSER